MGYPGKDLLRQWCNEHLPERKKPIRSSISYSDAYKQRAVIDFALRSGSATQIADKYQVSRQVLYSWKDELQIEKSPPSMLQKKNESQEKSNQILVGEVEALQLEIRRLQLEKEILEGTVELIKKDPGADPKKLTNREKTLLICTLTERYNLHELLESLDIARSSFFYHKKVISAPNKYEDLIVKIKEIYTESDGTYGYRRVHAALKQMMITVSEKVVRRLMKESGLVVIQKKKRKYSSYKGEKLPSATNLIKRNFHASKPNRKWLTDITEFHIPAGKVYLSPVVDCFDGLIVSWTIGTSPNADMANSMLDLATATLKRNEKPIIHSDRGFHYRLPGWLSRVNEHGLKRSMSKKGYTPDNAACEGVFGRIKNEMFYNKSWTGVSVDEFMKILDDYLWWYNEKRIKISLGGISPMQYRKSLGLAS